MLPVSDMAHVGILHSSSQKEHGSKMAVHGQALADLYTHTDSEAYHIKGKPKLCVSKPSVLLNDKEFDIATLAFGWLANHLFAFSFFKAGDLHSFRAPSFVYIFLAGTRP